MVKKTGRKTNYWKKVYLCCLILILFSAVVYVEFSGAQTTEADYPHNVSSNNVSCTDCHVQAAGPDLNLGSPPMTVDAQCLTCHNEVSAPFEETHSSLNTSGTYGTWSVGCITCHDPHNQAQVSTYGPESYLYTSTSAAVTSGTEFSWIRSVGANWAEHQWAGMMVIGNTAAVPQVFHNIYDNTSDTLTLEGPVTDAASGNTFAIVYGGLIKNAINYTKTNVIPNVLISGPTKLFQNAGQNSFTDGTPTGSPAVATNGICIICHTLTTHQKNDGTDVSHYTGQYCLTCHSHEGGFGKYASDSGMFGSASGSGFQFGGSRSWDPGTDPVKAMNSPNAAYAKVNGVGTCNGIYCHSNGAVNGSDNSNLAYRTTPAWQGGSFGANKCGSCHDNPPQYTGQSHYTANGFMNKEGGHLVGIHFDNIYDSSGGLLAAGATDPSSHGDPSTSTTISCYLCHNGEISSTTIDTHALDNLSSSAMKCSTCHSSPQVGAIMNKSLHVNGQKDVVLADAFTVKSKAQLADSSIPAGWTRNGTYKTTGSYDSATMNTDDWNSNTKTCTTACHNNNAVTWGATTITCVSCHTALP